MKATQQPQLFQPVTLLLETQEEVDGLFALLSMCTIRAGARLPAYSYKALEAFANKEVADKIHSELCKILR